MTFIEVVLLIGGIAGVAFGCLGLLVAHETFLRLHYLGPASSLGAPLIICRAGGAPRAELHGSQTSFDRRAADRQRRGHRGRIRSGHRAAQGARRDGFDGTCCPREPLASCCPVERSRCSMRPSGLRWRPQSCSSLPHFLSRLSRCDARTARIRDDRIATALTGGAVLRAGLGIFLGVGTPPKVQNGTRGTDEHRATDRDVARPPLTMLGPVVVLLAGGLTLGLIPGLAEHAAQAAHQLWDSADYAAAALDGTVTMPSPPAQVESWSPSGLLLGVLSALLATLVAGVTLYLDRLPSLLRKAAGVLASPLRGLPRTQATSAIT